MNKKLSELNENELIELLKTSDNTAVTLTTTDVTSFIVQFNIKSGNEKVNLKRLKSVYDDWSNDSVTLKQFINEVVASTGSERTGYTIKLNLDTSKLNLTHIDILKKKEIKTLNKEMKQFSDFINKHNIKSGKEVINIKLIDFIYDKERFEENKKRIDKRLFTKLLKNHFDIIPTSKGDALMLDKSIYDVISKDKMDELLLNWTLYEEKKQKK